MRPTDILEAFAGFESPNDIRHSAAAPDLLAALPTDPGEYVSAARQLLSDLTAEQYARWNDEINTYQRFEDCLRELFYADKRSAEALIWIVEWASTTRDFADFGVNPLAAFVYQLDRPLPRELETKFVPLLERCLSVEPLVHNAEACLREIRKRERRSGAI